MTTDRARGGERRSPFLRLSDGLNGISERLLFLLMAAMILLTILQIVFRLLGDALIWSEEVICFALVAATMVGASVAFKRGSHIAVTSLIDRLSPERRKIMACLVHGVGMAFFVVVAWYGVVLMRGEAFQTTPALGIPMSWIYLLYPLTGAVTLVHLVSALVETLRS
ncbi:TRAP transporter small permease [Aminithiophilus ramosus]|uniref:TRAP transporter small permease n=1 Tax=Aminithiophilus ramosus TaxID=3029084 RepID=A0A9Q7A7I2_9BACT|nr:TRAP transporter small permease [Aminithiophilus ramosus]QTX32176.1 TRAP transporter small permease [Aminithiophilus ramosus]